MLSRYNAVDIEHALRNTSPPPPFPPAANRAAWEHLREQLGPERVRELIAQAEHDATSPIPLLPATLFLDVARTGRREGYQEPRSRRRQMLCNLAVAECL